MSQMRAETTDEPFNFQAPPRIVGRWVIGGCYSIHVYETPNRLHILMAKWLLGWQWKPYVTVPA